MKKLNKLVMIVLLSGAAWFVGAQEKPQQSYENMAGMRSGQDAGMGRDMPTFTDFDLSGDSFLTEDEFNEARSQLISKRSNQGNMISGSITDWSFSEFDRNSDGKVNDIEFLQTRIEH